MGAILGQFGVEVVSPKELGDHCGRGGDREHLRENAMLKAKAI